MGRQKPEVDEVRIQFRGELATQVREYMAMHGHLSTTDAMREILTVFFASTPMDGVVRAARDNVTNNLKHWMMTRMNNTLKELQAELESQVTALENSGWGR